MIYISPVNNHAFSIIKVSLRDGVGKGYELLTQEQNIFRKVETTYEFDVAMEWLGVKAVEQEIVYIAAPESK